MTSKHPPRTPSRAKKNVPSHLRQSSTQSPVPLMSMLIQAQQGSAARAKKTHFFVKLALQSGRNIEMWGWVGECLTNTAA